MKQRYALCVFYILILMPALLRYTALTFSVTGWAIYVYYIIISHWYKWLKFLHHMYPVVIKVSCVPSDRFYVSSSLIFTIYDIKVDKTSDSQPLPPVMTSSIHEHKGFRCVLTVLHLIANYRLWQGVFCTARNQLHNPPAPVTPMQQNQQSYFKMNPIFPFR